MEDALPAVVICDGKTKGGNPCRCHAGENGRQCFADAPETRGVALEASQAGAEKRDESLLIELRRQVLRNPEAVVRPILEALAATKSWLSNGELVTVPDYATRIEPFETVADRLLGKPTQSTEITGADGGPLLALLRVAAEQGSRVMAISLDDPETREAVEQLRVQNYVSFLKIDGVGTTYRAVTRSPARNSTRKVLVCSWCRTTTSELG